MKIVKGVISPQRRKERKGKTRTIIQTEILDFELGLRRLFHVERSATSLERSNRFVLQHNFEIPIHEHSAAFGRNQIRNTNIEIRNKFK